MGDNGGQKKTLGPLEMEIKYCKLLLCKKASLVVPLI